MGELPGFGVPGFDPGFVVPGFVEPGLFEPGFVEFGFVEPGLADPGAVGLVFGVVPGVVSFGDVGGGCVVLFGVLGFVGLDPGVLGEGVAPVGGAVVLPVGGWAVLPVGGCPGVPVAGADGVAWPRDAWLADPVLPAVPLPPLGAACAIAHAAQQRTIDSNVRFLPDFMKTSSVEFSALPCNAGARAERQDA